MKLISLVVVGVVVYCIYQEYKNEMAAVWLELNSLKYAADSRFKELSLAVEN